MDDVLYMIANEISSNKIVFYSFCFSIIAFYLLVIIGLYKIFEKANEKGWKSLIPVYNIYILYKIFWQKKYFALLVIVSAICIIPTYFIYSQELFELLVFIATLNLLYHQIILSVRISRSFQKNILWSLGIVFLPYLFIIILGFNKSKYIKFEDNFVSKKTNVDNTMKKVENVAGKVDIIMRNKLIIALFLIVEGISILFNPAGSLIGMARNIIMLVFFAAFLSLVTNLSAKPRDTKSIIISLLIVIGSVITYIYPDLISAYIQLFLALFIIYDGLSNIFNILHLTKFSGYAEKIASKYNKIANKKSSSEDVDKGMEEQKDKFVKPIENILSKSNKSTVLYLVVNIATVILGILLLVSSYSMVVWGIIFLYTGTSDLIVSMKTMNIVSKIKEKRFKDILFGEEKEDKKKKTTTKKTNNKKKK